MNMISRTFASFGLGLAVWACILISYPWYVKNIGPTRSSTCGHWYVSARYVYQAIGKHEPVTSWSDLLNAHDDVAFDAIDLDGRLRMIAETGDIGSRDSAFHCRSTSMLEGD